MQEWQIKKVAIVIPAEPAEDQLTKLRDLLIPGKIPLEIQFCEQQKQLSLAARQTIVVSIELLSAIATNNFDVRVTL